MSTCPQAARIRISFCCLDCFSCTHIGLALHFGRRIPEFLLLVVKVAQIVSSPKSKTVLAFRPFLNTGFVMHRVCQMEEARDKKGWVGNSDGDPGEKSAKDVVVSQVNTKLAPLS